MKAKGSDLIFISQIKRDGSGVNTDIEDGYLEYLKDVEFELKPLSLTQKTFIAFNFNVFVVKMKV